MIHFGRLILRTVTRAPEGRLGRQLWAAMALMVGLSLPLMRAEAFELDMARKDVFRVLKIHTVGDLVVGDKALVETWGSFCWKEDNQLYLSTTSRVPELSKYSNQFMVEREPGNTVSLMFFIEDKEAVRSQLREAGKILMNYYSCDSEELWENNLFDNKQILLRVSTMNGFSRLSDIMNEQDQSAPN